MLWPGDVGSFPVDAHPRGSGGSSSTSSGESSSGSGSWTGGESLGIKPSVVAALRARALQSAMRDA